MRCAKLQGWCCNEVALSKLDGAVYALLMLDRSGVTDIWADFSQWALAGVSGVTPP